jgi:PAS domain S-box-containing protein
MARMNAVSLLLDAIANSPLLFWGAGLMLVAAAGLGLLTWWRRPVESIRRWGPVVVAGLAGTGMTLLAFISLHQAARQEYEAVFQVQAMTRVNVINNAFSYIVDELADTAHFFEASEQVRVDEFARFCHSSVDQRPVALAMLWCPCGWPAAAPGLGRVPVAYCQSLSVSPMILPGTDLAADPLYRRTMEAAASSGQPLATAPFAIQGVSQPAHCGVLVFMPVYGGAAMPQGAAERRSALQGFVVGAYDVVRILQHAIGQLPEVGFNHKITDRHAPPGSAAVADLLARRGEPLTPEQLAREPSLVRPVRFAGCDWTVSIVPSTAFRQAHGSTWHASSLAFGLLLTLLAMLYLQQLQSGRLQAERLVAERTAQLQTKQESLIESEARHRIVADNTYTWEFWQSPDGQFVYVSPSCERISGYPAAAFIANPGLMTQIVHPDDQDLYGKSRGGEPILADKEIEFRILRADGEIRWIAQACQPLFGPGNRCLGIRGSNRDVTRQHRFQLLQTARNQAFDKIATGASLAETLAAFVPPVGHALPGHAFAIDLLDEAGMRLHTAAAVGIPESFRQATAELEMGPAAAASGVAVQRKCRVVVADLATHPSWMAFRDAARKAGLASAWTEPVRAASGAVIGALTIYSGQSRLPGEEELEMLSEIGQLAGLVVEHAKVVQSLRDRDARIQRLGDNLPAGTIYQLLCLPDGRRRFLYLSEGIEAIAGISMAPLLADAEPLYQAMPPLERARLIAAEQTAMDSRSALDLKVKVLLPDAEVHWLHFRAAPHRQDDGATLWDGIILDVTEQAQAEQKLRKMEMAIEQSPAVVVITDPKGTIEFVNPSFERSTGYSSAEVIGLNPRVLKSELYPPAFYQNLWDTVLAGNVWKGELCNRRKDGSFYWELAAITVIRDADGSISHLLAVKEDITSRKQVETELEKAKIQAEEANRAKSLFLANMSHEIRTPLNAILGFSQLLRHDPAVTPQQAQRLDSISRGGEHLLALISDILEMSKIEAGRIVCNPVPINLRRLFDDLEAMFRIRTDAKRLMFSVEHLGELPEQVEADEGKLRQILINLLGNAVKFTEKGGIVLRIRSFPAETAGAIRLVVEVEDTGPGIAPAELERLFTSFAQTSSGIKAGGGTGLGLAISREFARIMGGEITVASALGSGSTFTFEMVAPLTTKPVPVADARRVIGLQPGQPPCRVLVVDDKEENRDLLTAMLRPLGFEIRESADGEQAVADVAAWRPQVILMDLRMPVMDGLEATRRIRAGAGPEIVKIIAVTASAFDEDRQAAQAAGVDGFIAKPFRESELLESLQRLAGVEYVYAVIDTEWPAADQPGPAATLSKALADDLRQAVQNGDLEALETAIGQLKPVDPVAAEHLRQLVAGFEYERLIQWLDASAG